MFCFYSHSPCFFKFFVLEKSLNFTGKLDLVMSGLASVALPKQTSHRERGGSSPMEPSSSETPSGSAKLHTPLCCACRHSNGRRKPLENQLPGLLLLGSDQGRTQVKKKICKCRKEATEGAGSITATPCATGSLSETVKKGWKWGKKLKPLQNCGRSTESNTWGRAAFSMIALFFRVLVLPIIHVQHRGLGTQQHSVAEVFFFRYRGTLSQLEASVGAE